MSSSEQAPEPTMDEILASIRKIISDDETGDDAQPEVAAAEPAAAEPAGDGLADDLANAIADAQGADSQAAAEPPDDILDLTQVVTEQPGADVSPEPAPQEFASPEPALQEAASPEPASPEPAMSIAADVQPDAAPAVPEADMMASAPVAPEVLAEIEASAAPEESESPESNAGASDITALLAEAGVQGMNDEAEAAPQEASAPASEDLNASIAQDDMSVPDSLLVEETSISDALSALDQPAGDAASDAAPQSQDVPSQDVPSQEVSSQDASFDADLVMSQEPAPELDDLSEAIAPEAAPEAMPEAEAVAEGEADAGFDVQMPELSAEETPAPAQIEDALLEPEALVIDEPAEAAAALSSVFEEPAPVEDALADSEAEIEAEAIVEAEAAAEVEAEAIVEAAAEVEAVDEVEIEAAAELEEAEAFPDADAEVPAAEVSTADAPAGDVRTLEDSVKELLRPMLREWLDDNMERIVQDEVASENPKDSDS